MGSLLDLRVRVADELAREDIPDQIGKALIDAALYYEAPGFAFAEAEQVLVTVPGQPWLNLPADFLHARSLSLLSNDTITVLRPWTYETYVGIEIDPDSNMSEPTAYAFWRDRIYFYANPDRDYSVTLHYLRSVELPSENTDSNEWTTSHEPLIRIRAKKDLMRNVIRDFEEAEILAREEMDWRLNLQAKNYRRRSTGRVRAMHL
jgi:hypothetical protein